MHKDIIGREEETAILDNLLKSKESELLAIYGRRRVGKTFLIRTYYKEQIAFSCIGESGGKTVIQMANFFSQLKQYFPEKDFPTTTTWQSAFQTLRTCIDGIKNGHKKVLFFDELPWLDTHKSGFLSAFGYFWNSYASQRNDLIIVICGSAASWILDKVVNNKGGLHNRITKRIRLMPFTLKETEAYLKSRSIKLERYQLLQLYMVMGGVPQYLKAVERGQSVGKVIENACFTKDGLLSGEFANLYSALFEHPDRHIEVVHALGKKNKGLTRTEILKASKLLTGGRMTKVLNELLESGFIQKANPFGKKEKDSLYRLIDEFSLFYYRFMAGKEKHTVERETWSGIQYATDFTTWCGYAFENICIKHVAQIKKALGIYGVQSVEASWRKAGTKNDRGAQIDLLIDRADGCINICEMKFSNKLFVIDRKYAAELDNKLKIFHENSETKKTLFLTMVTTYGVFDNDYREQRMDAGVTMEALFD